MSDEDAVPVLKLTDARHVNVAAAFVADHIPDVDLARIGRAQDRNHQTCWNFLHAMNNARGTASALPPDLWLGVIEPTGYLAGVLHAAPIVGGAARNIELIYQRHPEAGSPLWVARLLRETLMVEEIAVTPESRHQGVGTTLLCECHRQATRRGQTRAGLRRLNLSATPLRFRRLHHRAAPDTRPAGVPVRAQNLLESGVQTTAPALTPTTTSTSSSTSSTHASRPVVLSLRTFRAGGTD